MKPKMFLIRVTSCSNCPQHVSQAEGILCLMRWKRVPKRVKTFPKWCMAQKWEGNLTVNQALLKRQEEIEEYKKRASKIKHGVS